MDEHDLLARLKREIGPDLVAVRPVRAPGTRALWMLVAWVLLGAAVLTLLGPRQDYAALGPWATIGWSVVEVILCGILVVIGFRLAIPGMPGSMAMALAWIAVALVADVVVDWSTLQRSAVSPAPGLEWRVGLYCLGAITLLGFVPFALSAMLLSGGLPSRPALAYTLAGLACGLAAVAAWRLHCSFTNWEHTLQFHTSGLALFVLAGLAAAAVPGRHR